MYFNEYVPRTWKAYASAILGCLIWFEFLGPMDEHGWQAYATLALGASMIVFGYFEIVLVVLYQVGLNYEKMANAMSKAKDLRPEERALFGEKLSNSVKLQPQTMVALQAVTSGGFYLSFYGLPAEPTRMRELAKALDQGAKLTNSLWAGRGKLFSDPEYRLLQNSLLERNYIRPKSKTGDVRQGFELTALGKAVMKAIAGGVQAKLTAGAPPWQL